MKEFDSDFISCGETCSGRVYLPEKPENPPVVIMAHGIAAEKDFVLPEFARRFAGSGMAVYLFDYRNFGESTGFPRNLVNPFRHLKDWRAAIRHVRTFECVDSSRIALWGTSFSGGHVIAAAASETGIRAVVSQVPFVDGFATASLFSASFIIKAFFHAMRDVARIITFRKPYYIPVVADPGNMALMNTPDAKPGYLTLVPKDSGWENKAPARAILLTLLYKPACHAGKVRCPVMVVCAEKDSLIPMHAVEKMAGKIKNVSMIRLDAGHFDVYSGEVFERVIKAETDFLKSCLTASWRDQRARAGGCRTTLESTEFFC